MMMIYEQFEYDEENLYDVYKLHYIIYIYMFQLQRIN